MHRHVRYVAVALAVVACTAESVAEPDAHDGSEATGGTSNAPDGGVAQASDAAPDGAGVAPADPSACTAGDPFDPVALHSTLAYLASMALAGRAPGTSGDKAARAFIEKQLSCVGIAPGGVNGGFQQPFTDSDKNGSANVIGVIPGTDPVVGKDIVFVGAHQDHLGQERGKLYLGANDNASGVTAVLAVARAIKALGAPKRTIAFALWNSEELGCEGSHYFVDRGGLPNLPIANVVYDVNFDMVGTYKQMKNTVDVQGSIAGTPGHAIMTQLLGKPGALPGARLNVPGLGEDDSDYWPFCAKAIPFIGFFTDDPACYHEPCDTEEKIDYVNLGKIAKLGADLVAGLASTPTDLAAYRKTAKVANLGCGED